MCAVLKTYNIEYSKHQNTSGWINNEFWEEKILLNSLIFEGEIFTLCYYNRYSCIKIMQYQKSTQIHIEFNHGTR